MATKVAINGFGRIGRAVARIILQRQGELELVAINDLYSSPAPAQGQGLLNQIALDQLALLILHHLLERGLANVNTGQLLLMSGRDFGLPGDQRKTTFNTTHLAPPVDCFG